MSVSQKSKKKRTSIARAGNKIASRAILAGGLRSSIVLSKRMDASPVSVQILRFQTTTATTTGAGGYAFNTFSINSPYDPYYPAGGGTCTGFSQYAALYSRFYVRKATIQVQPSVFGGTSLGDTFAIIPYTTDEVAGGFVPTIDNVENGKTVFNLVTSDPAHTYMCLRQTVCPHALEGLGLADRDELSGTSGADPTTQPCWAVTHFGAQGHTVSYTVIIEYETEFYRPTTLGTA